VKGSEIPEDDTRYLQKVLAACRAGIRSRRQSADHWQQVGRARAQVVSR